ncbi:DUF6508 domain-containing protein [Rhodococcus sp. NPDC058505]|uniref:DUF6508 domain-containing protein n=1 Tax=Rhodococcus sp. NPDC058505 TaxID=3346531 RepID=UPI003667E282
MTDEVARELVELAEAKRASLTPSDWATLREITERVTAHAGPFAEWVPPKRIGDNSFEIGYSSWGSLAGEVVRAVYDLGLVVPFAWPQWEDAQRLLAPATFDPDTLTWPQTVGLLTLLLRQDRFSDGTVAEAFEDGALPKLLVRLLDFAPTRGECMTVASPPNPRSSAASPHHRSHP